VRSEPFELSPESRALIEARLQDSGLDTDADSLFAFVAQAVCAREAAKLAFTCSLSAALELVADFGEIYGLQRADVAMLEIGSLLRYCDRPLPARLGDILLEQVSKARVRRRIESGILLPELIFGVEDLDVVRQRTSRPNFVTSASVSAPVVRLDAGIETRNFEHDLAGHIVLIEGADPGYDWIFDRQIAGLITRYGGANSHMTIRCAEFGLPAAIGCGATVFERCNRALSLELDCGQERIHVLG
jgi:hypothetical protein